MRLLRTKGVVALAALLLALTACSGGTASSSTGTNSTLVVAETVPPQTFDPTQSSQIATMYAWQLVYNGLVRVDNTGQVQPDLATAWTMSADRKSYDFTLRPGAKFSDGSPVTADDVVFSFQRLLSDGLPYAKARFASLGTVTKIDDAHVRFGLTQPDAGFLLNLGSPFLIGSAILSKNWSTSHNPKTDVMGAGPFKVVSYSPNSELVLQRNDNYWNTASAPKYQQLDIKYMPDQSAQVAALQSGQVDLVFPSAENALQMRNNSQVKIVSVPGANTIRLNINSSRKPFDNPDVRRAISLALNRQEIVQGAFLGQAVPSAQLPPSTPWAVPLDQLPNQSMNVAQAKALLAKAGYPNGIDITLDHLAGYGTYLDRFAELVKTELAQAGIRVNIQANQNTVWLDHQNKANYDILDNVYAFTGDPMSLLSPRPGRQGPTPPEMTALMNSAVAGDPTQYASKLQQLAKMQADLAFPDITVAAPNAMIAYGSKVNSAQPDPTLARQFLTAVTLK
jgi:peptide/nickel transport system substrate-binding protein